MHIGWAVLRHAAAAGGPVLVALGEFALVADGGLPALVTADSVTRKALMR